MAIYDPNSNQHSDGADTISKTPYYFSVHVFFSRHDGYSIPVKIYADEEPTEDEVIEYCVENDKFAESGDENYVDTVDEIDLKEYNEMKN